MKKGHRDDTVREYERYPAIIYFFFVGLRRENLTGVDGGWELAVEAVRDITVLPAETVNSWGVFSMGLRPAANPAEV